MGTAWAGATWVGTVGAGAMWMGTMWVGHKEVVAPGGMQVDRLQSMEIVSKIFLGKWFDEVIYIGDPSCKRFVKVICCTDL